VLIYLSKVYLEMSYAELGRELGISAVAVGKAMRRGEEVYLGNEFCLEGLMR
jgi:hypothetical protein